MQISIGDEVVERGREREWKCHLIFDGCKVTGTKPKLMLPNWRGTDDAVPRDTL